MQPCVDFLLVDLIDSMLVVDPERRFTVKQCMAHPWMTAGTAARGDITGASVPRDLSLERRVRGRRSPESSDAYTDNEGEVSDYVFSEEEYLHDDEPAGAENGGREE